MAALAEHEGLLCDFSALRAAKADADRVLKAYDVKLRRKMLAHMVAEHPQLAAHNFDIGEADAICKSNQPPQATIERFV